MIRIRMATAIVAALVTVSTNGYGASLKQIRQLPWTDDSATSLAVARPISTCKASLSSSFPPRLGARIEKLPKEDRYASRDQAGVFLGGLHGL
jgi:hypothetical protein